MDVSNAFVAFLLAQQRPGQILEAENWVVWQHSEVATRSHTKTAVMAELEEVCLTQVKAQATARER